MTKPKNQNIETFIDNNFSKDDILELIEDDSIVYHMELDEFNESLIKEIKEFGDHGYRTERQNAAIVIYFAKSFNQILFESNG